MKGFSLKDVSAKCRAYTLYVFLFDLSRDTFIRRLFHDKFNFDVECNIPYIQFVLIFTPFLAVLAVDMLAQVEYVYILLLPFFKAFSSMASPKLHMLTSSFLISSFSVIPYIWERICSFLPGSMDGDSRTFKK